MPIPNVVNYKSFKEFFNDVALPSGKYFSKFENGIFRGHSRHTYELFPTLLREYSGLSWDERIVLKDKPKYGGCGPIYDQFQTLRKFYTKANHNGLTLPAINSSLDSLSNPTSLSTVMRQNGEFGEFRWIPDDLLNLVAMAQHYGLPTRLLDWTADLNVACYFACIGTIRRLLKAASNTTLTKELKTRMAIYALDAESIRYRPRDKNNCLRFVVPPYADNPNLRAQKGVFTLWDMHIANDLVLVFGNNYEADPFPLEDLLSIYGSDSLLFKFELPANECLPMYRYLQRIEYGAARLFPGYKGVVTEMEDDAMALELEVKLENFRKSRHEQNEKRRLKRGIKNKCVNK